MALRILYTNNTLGKPAGTELSLHDACVAMKARGHEVAAFSRQLGEIAERLRRAGVTVVDDLEVLPWQPDVIHGQHEWETTLAALRWPQVPVISFCRGPYLWQEAPCRAPNVVQWVAVDAACRQRLVEKEGIPADKVRIVLNGVNLERFRARPPLPAKPEKALVFSNYATEQNYLPAVREACAAEGIALTVIGAGVGNVVPHPEDKLGDFDIVFAKGRAALEAVTTGCALVVCDSAGLGPMASTANFTGLRELSFGNPCMTDLITPTQVRARLRAYDARDATSLGQLARSTCGVENTIDQLQEIYLGAGLAKVATDHQASLACAVKLMTRITLPYKLGRKMQESWHDRRVECDPDLLAPELADRIFSNFLRGDEKLLNAQAKNNALRKKMEKLKIRLDRAKADAKSARLRGAIGKAWSKLLGKPHPPA